MASVELFDLAYTCEILAVAKFISIIFKNSVNISQETHYVSATKPNRLMLFREIIAVYCENHMGHINTLFGQNAVFYPKAESR
jgi:hypothetical protein